MDYAIALKQLWFPSYLLAINLLTFFIYGSDKLFAKTNAWRVRERTLLLLALIGGSPGALIGMCLFRHKTKKPRFGFLLAIILLGQVALVFFLLNQPPSQLQALDLRL